MEDFCRLSLAKTIKLSFARKDLNFIVATNLKSNKLKKFSWLKLYDSTLLKSLATDKFRMKDYVARKIGTQFVIPIINVWENPDSIDLNALPNQFVLKTNHGCDMNIFVKDKSNFDLEHAKEIDYQFFCSYGKVLWCQVGTESHSSKWRITSLDLNWMPTPFQRIYHETHLDLPPMPQNFELMIDISKKLSEDLALVRIDFYETDKEIFVGELTFTPKAGIFVYEPIKWNFKLGDMIQLPPRSEQFKL